MNQISDALQAAIGQSFEVDDVFVELSRPEPQFGDYSTNIAMKLAKKLGKNPREVAEQICTSINDQKYDWLVKTEVAGPGFINFYFTDAKIWELATSKPHPFLANHTTIIEYSCPNAFKELHAGHLYQTIVGDVLGNIMERAGAKVVRTNFGGDVGLHVAKSMWGVQALLGGFSFEELTQMPEAEHASFLSEAYVLGAKNYEDNADAKTQIEQFNKQIYEIHSANDHESDFAKVYWLCREWSYEYFKEFYSSIEVKNFDRYYPESETAPIGLSIVNESTGVFEESNGAVVFKGEEAGLHTRVFITSEGLPTYETKDLGVIKLEHDEFKFDRRFLITGNDQTEYMRVVFEVANRVIPEADHKMTHLTNGTIRFGDGQKMSSRLGNVNRAVDVVSGVYDAVEADNAELRKTLALGAVKYSFLKQRLGADIAFDLQESVNLHGNSGPYLQYAYVRAFSILQKATASEVAPDFTEEERLFARKLSQFETVLCEAAVVVAHQIICTYLYELAQSFNRFYENNMVIGDERQAIRLMLVARYAEALKDGLRVLGIRVPEKM